MKKISIFLLLIFLLTLLVIPAAAETTEPAMTAPPMPTISLPSDTAAETQSTLPENLGSIIGVCLAGVGVVVVATVVIIKKRK